MAQYLVKTFATYSKEQSNSSEADS